LGKRADWFEKACSQLRLKFERDYVFIAKDGTRLKSTARISEHGSPKGILVFDDYDLIIPHIEEICGLEEGFSIFKEPYESDTFDLEQHRAIFLDWGFVLP
jgi:hypothetical protein